MSPASATLLGRWLRWFSGDAECAEQTAWRAWRSDSTEPLQTWRAHRPAWSARLPATTLAVFALRAWLCFLTLGAFNLGCAEARGEAAAIAPAFVRVEGKHFVGADGEPLHLRGINLGNWLLPEGYMWQFERAASPRQIENVVAELVGDVTAAEFWRAWRDNYITRADLQLIRRVGFNSVRIPLNWRLFVTETSPFRMEGPGWALLDRVIGWCRDEHIYAIIDLHAAPGGQTGSNIDDSRGRPLLFEDPGAQQLTIDLWTALAKRYRGETWVLGYDLLNEPIAHYFNQERLNPRLAEFYRRIVPAIREIDPQHVILIGGAQWNTQFAGLGPPFADNLAYAFHLYWAKPNEASLKRYLEWRDQFNAPMWLGESGENTDDWLRTFRLLLDQHEIDWCFWPYKKMVESNCVASIAKPADWSAIVAYAETPRGDDYEAIRKALPSLEVSRRALAQLLENSRLERCGINAGFLHALGLNVPPAEGQKAKR